MVLNEAVREFFWRGPDGSTSLIRSAWLSASISADLRVISRNTKGPQKRAF
jgi:hypothetical protein